MSQLGRIVGLGSGTEACRKLLLGPNIDNNKICCRVEPWVILIIIIGVS